MDNATTKNPRRGHVTDHEATARKIVQAYWNDYNGVRLIAAIAAALAEAGNPHIGSNCPKCDSPSPRLHPAMQYEGEVQECNHPFHAVADRDRFNKENADLRAKLAEAERERDYFDTERQLIMARELRLSDEHEKLLKLYKETT